MEGVGAAWLADAFAPIRAAFGPRLVFARDGSAASWSVGASVARVALRPEGLLEAAFIDRSCSDAAGGPAGAVYRTPTAAYRLDRDGAARMAADMLAFFSGTREPRFVFADAIDLA